MKKELSRVLYSRYKDVETRYIVDVGADHASLVTNGAYSRVGTTPDEKSISFVDFEGGPMISVGDEFNGRKIKSIEHGYILTLE